jgi:hypothetical protein
MPKTLCLGVAVLFGVALAANGIFMLVAPETWYFTVPGVTSTGPFNQHFLRDIGLIFLFLGGAFLVGAARPQMRVLLLGRAHHLAFVTFAHIAKRCVMCALNRSRQTRLTTRPKRHNTLHRLY